MILCKYYNWLPTLFTKIQSIVDNDSNHTHDQYLKESIQLIDKDILEIVSMPYPKVYFKISLCLNTYQISLSTLILVFILQRIRTVNSFFDNLLLVILIVCFLFSLQIFSDFFLRKFRLQNIFYQILKDDFRPQKIDERKRQNLSANHNPLPFHEDKQVN